MCNDYGLNAPLSLINQRFGQVDRPLLFPEGAPNLGPRDDIRPTETAPIVRASGGTGGVELLQLRWGFGPGKPKAPPVINFRSEGRRFGNAATGGRCLIPASHFYEFTAPEAALGSSPRVTKGRALKSKWEFTPTDQPDSADRMFCIAGLWRAANEAAPASFTMLTCAPGPDIAPLHDRQIVTLPPDRWTTWLEGDPDAAGALLAPSPAGTWSVRQVR